MKKSIFILLFIFCTTLTINATGNIEILENNEIVSSVSEDENYSRCIFTVNVNGNVVRAYADGTITRNGRAIYKGQRVLAMIVYKGDLITAFAEGGIYRSRNGLNPAGGGNGKKVYDGTQKVVFMRTYRGGVLTTFDQGGTYLSPDGNNLGGGGKTKPRSIRIIRR